MPKYTVYLLLFVVLFTAFSCKNEPKAKENSLFATTTLDPNSVVYLEVFQGGEPEKIDSARVGDNGELTLGFNGGLLNFYRLRPKDSFQGIMLLLQREEKDIYLYGTLFDNSVLDSVSGSKHSRLLHSLYAQMAQFEERIDSIRTESNFLLQEGENAKAMQLFRKGVALSTAYKNYLLSFVTENATSPATLAALDKLEINKNPELFELISESLGENFSHSSFFASLKQNYENFKTLETKQQQVVSDQKLAAERVEIGKEAPEIKLKNLQGEIVPLSSTRGKYVLIDFWASWCAPCRRENPLMVKVYEKYKQYGFEIYGVSLDRNKVPWEAAVEADGLPWIQVSDLQYWNSAAAKEYGITAIPYTFLLDTSGVIIAHNLKAATLEPKLKSIFNL
ncbi:MAG: TlpA family protein disulfide reductase [Luteibaculaceae bacterium]